MTFRPGDIVLVQFPFTDLASTKKRPALVVSPSDYSARYGDIVVLALTSVDQHEEALRISKWKESGFPKPTWIKPLIGTLSKSLVVRRLGRLESDDGKRVQSSLRKLIDKGYLH
ncbi:MAG: type II toxin-antitoxin system PemK/MazF family toxin [Planctomycetes bacterium]|nr:type II toxin-antitoxin system PemK/MazF family toxin [Planctomycetota bacterium]